MAGVDSGEGGMTEEEDTIVDIRREADIVEDIEVDLGATLRTERLKREATWSQEYYR